MYVRLAVRGLWTAREVVHEFDAVTVRRGIGQGFGFGIGCLLLGVAGIVTLWVLGSSAQRNAEIGGIPVPTLPLVVEAPTSAPVVEVPTDAPAVPAVLLSLKGSGIQRTEKFTATGDWTIAYTYDCTSFGFDGILQVYVYAADGTITDVAVNALGKQGEGSQPEYRPGTFYLDVNSTCDWTIEVKG